MTAKVSLLALALLIPTVAGLPVFSQDDAGSGRDAPDEADPAFLIEPFVAYESFFDWPYDSTDWYAFEAEAGQRLSVRAAGHVGCFYVYDSEGVLHQPFACDYVATDQGGVQMALPRSGVWYLKVHTYHSGPYRFSIGLDGPAPDVSYALPVGDGLLPQDDAGSGRDAPEEPDPAFVVETGVVHAGYMDAATDSGDVYGFQAEAGDVIDPRARGLVGCYTVYDPDGAQHPAHGCSYGEATEWHEAPFLVERTGVWYVRFAQLAAGPYRFVIERNESARDLAPTAPLVGDARLLGGDDPTCGTGAPVTATSGAGDPALPSLVFAALKTGFRAVVAWETDEPVVATLQVSLDGGAPATLTQAIPSRQHVFFLDGLPLGRTLCFTPEGGSPHALRLANAMNAYDAATGTYSLNLVVLANEQPDGAAVEAALQRFAETWWDATDGHVRVGRVLTLYGDYERHNPGWGTCVRLETSSNQRPLCAHVHDVLFTHVAHPAGAASTTSDAIRSTSGTIWMNQYWQAGIVRLPDDTGRVLTHEMGHYVFGAQDLYGSLAGTGPDCWDPAKGLSVMGGNRAATEFDDEANRCPNEADLAGYVPTWTLLREDFPLVPERTVVDAGPEGDGGAFASHAFTFAPQASDHVQTSGQDDAGSGRDAGGTAEDAVPIEPGVAHEGTALGLLMDDKDFYAFDGEEGQVAEVVVRGTVGCYALLDPSLQEMGSSCSYGHATFSNPVVATLRQTGRHYLEVVSLAPAAYEFSLGLDAPAPHVGPPVPPPQDDAGSGRDAGGSAERAVPIEPGVAHEATLLGPLLDMQDYYSFDAVAGQTAEIAVTGPVGCHRLHDASLAEIASACTYGPASLQDPMRVTLPATGRYFLEVGSLTPATYTFGLGLDAPAPGL